METYKTVEEMAVQWGVSPRQIQYLCRTGKIAGAMKRAGAWFIPGDAPDPTKNTKSGVLHFQFAGTRKKIFNSAIELFRLNGYDNVSVKDIADEVGVRQSTIYNHFKSKQDILDTIYDFYRYYYLADRLSLEDIDPILREGSLSDIINCITYEFKDDYRQNMIDITALVFHRNAIDDRAREITKSLTVEEGIRYVEVVFDRAVEIGRLAPFDTHAMAVFINSMRIFILLNGILDPSPNNMLKLAEDEQTLYQHTAKLIKDLKLPPERGN